MSVRFNMVMDDQLAEALQQFATTNNMSTSALMREALKFYVQGKNAQADGKRIVVMPESEAPQSYVLPLL